MKNNGAVSGNMIDVDYGRSVLSLPGSLVKLLPKLSEAEIRILILIYSSPEYRGDEYAVEEKLAGELSFGADEITQAIKNLRAHGFFARSLRAAKTPSMSAKKADEKAPQVNEAQKKDEKKKSEDSKADTAVIPSYHADYTGEQVASLVDSHPEYKVIIDEAQKICGTMFTPTEISRVIGMADYLKMSLEHILLMFSFCAGKGKNSVAYVTKTAYTLYNQGIDSLPAFEEYVKTSELFDNTVTKVRAIFGMGTRSLSSKEKETIAGWCAEEYPEELIKLAYDVAINNGAKVPFSYTAKVLEKWNASGYKTVSDVEAARDRYRQQKMQNTSFDTDEFFEAALRRGSKKMGEENGTK